MGKSISKQLVDKSVEAFISAVEIYNKPDFKYREENFSILMINAWELLFKAKLLEKNSNDRRSIYVEINRTTLSGQRDARKRYKKSRSGNYLTLELLACLGRLESESEVPSSLRDNIETLLEIRDSSIHFYNSSIQLQMIIHEIGSASVIDFVHYLGEWFSVSLSKFNLYLLPLSFFKDKSVPIVAVSDQEERIIKFVDERKKAHPFRTTNTIHYSLRIEVGFTKGKNGVSGLFITNDPKATPVRLTNQQIKEKWPLEYGDLITKCEERYSDFIRNSKFFRIKSIAEQMPKYCYLHYSNLEGSGTPKKYYSSAMLEYLDNHYSKK